MKVIELISKLINGEEVPNKIEYDGVIWHLCINRKDYYSDEALINNYLANCELSRFINDEIEIIEEDIEEDKPIEKLDYYYKNTYGRLSQHKASEIDIIDKINELVKAVKKLEKSEEKNNVIIGQLLL